MAELNESKTGVQASCQIAHCTTILEEVPLMFHAYTPEDLKQMDEVLNTMAQECIVNKLTPDIFKNKYYFQLQRQNQKSHSDAVVKEVAEILEMYVHNVTSNFGFGFNNGFVLCALAGKMNHSCDPNAMLFFTQKAAASQCAVTCVALRNIEKGEEICISYAIDTQLTSRLVRQAGLRNNPGMQFACICTRCMTEAHDDFIVSLQELSQLFSNMSPSDFTKMKKLIQLETHAVGMSNLLEDFLWLESEFRPERQTNFARHTRCATQFRLFVIENLLRMFVLNKNSSKYTSLVLKALESLPTDFLDFIEKDQRFMMRMFIVLLLCYAPEISKCKELKEPIAKTQQFIVLCTNPTFQWALKHVLLVLRFNAFIPAFTDDCICIPALQPALTTLMSMLKLLEAVKLNTVMGFAKRN